MTKTTDITSTTEYRGNQPRFHAQLRESGRPLFITNRGKTEAVLLSPEVFDALLERADLYDSLASIRRSEEDFDAGRYVDARKGVLDIAARHGLNLDQ